jgi:hypothetical protein
MGKVMLKKRQNLYKLSARGNGLTRKGGMQVIL